MRDSLLSIDWDYFIITDTKNWGSFLENDNSIINSWYKRYLEAKRHKRNIYKEFELSSQTTCFWDKIKDKFNIDPQTVILVTDSHSNSYHIAKQYLCTKVYSFDAHSDLGYGGLHSLKFEINCANWLGKLLKANVIQEANIIYPYYTQEKKEDFIEINKNYNIKYQTWETIPSNIYVKAIHICRSGAWTPPWFEDEFFKFIQMSRLNYKVINCPARNWDTSNIKLSDEIIYLLA